MAMILDAFVGRCVDRLTALVEDRVVMVLGVKDELTNLLGRMEMMEGVVKDAERRRIQDSAINIWVSRLKDVMYDADDIIDLCMIEGAALLNAQPSSSSSPAASVRCHFPLFSCFTSVLDLPVRYKIAKRIRGLNGKLEEIYKNKTMFSLERTTQDVREISEGDSRQTSSLLVESDVVGSDIQDATNRLVESLASGDGQSCLIIAVVGMGGIGKTTLAKKIFNDKRVEADFPIRAWACVSQKYSETDLLKQIIREAGGIYRDDNTKGELQRILKNTISEKHFFLVLDDVWRAEVWLNLLREPLQMQSGGAGGRILVTTRDTTEAIKMGAAQIHPVKQLPDSSGWELLCKSVFPNGNEEDIQRLRDIGIQIVQKCDGLPLAIKAIAGVLITKNQSPREWENVLRNDAWSMNNLPEELRGALYLSYEDLPSHLKQCFLHCSLFPEDHTYHRCDLVRMWEAEGFVKTHTGEFLEDTAEDYYKELIRRNLLQPLPIAYDESRCTMHDLLRSLAQALSQDESFYGDTKELNSTTTTKLRRLSISESGEIAVIPEPIIEQKCLRTLLLITSPPRFENGLLARLQYLRVLYLNEAGIESIPDSVGDLVHLRFLDLDRTSISKLPESIGCLKNLQILNLQGCQSLHTLPKGITQLCNLRRLGLSGTPLHFVPKGIGKLKELNDLEGFVVGVEGTIDLPQEHGCSLEDLEPLSQLRELHMDKLERALVSTGASPLGNKAFLRRLVLYCTPQSDREEIAKIEELFKELLPPKCLEEFYIVGFFGREYPSWMMSSSLGACLPNLTYLHLLECISCPQLPQLGQLPNLRYLQIKGAPAIISIGPEFLGSGVREGTLAARSGAFPKLEMLWMENMLNWEEWTFGRDVEEEILDDEIRETSSSKVLLLPHLMKLHIEDCPKLRALPRGLRHCPKHSIHIEGAHKLTSVVNLTSLTEFLQIINNRCLETVSNLPALRELIAFECPSLKWVEKLDALQHLRLRDGRMECLPEWLSTLLQQRQQIIRDDNLLFELFCNIGVLKRCLKGCPDWPIIQQFPRVNVYEIGGNGRLSYTKVPFSYETNVSES